jgi:hypothetical protein
MMMTHVWSAFGQLNEVAAPIGGVAPTGVADPCLPAAPTDQGPGGDDRRDASRCRHHRNAHGPPQGHQHEQAGSCGQVMMPPFR